MPPEDSLADFWTSWKLDLSNFTTLHRAVSAIYQNTIDYDNPPTIANLPDCTVLQDLTWNNAIDLADYSTDPESTAYELTWQITHVTDGRCGASIDTWGYVDLAPQAGWLGSCDVTVQVSDGIKTGSSDTFNVRVAPVRGRAYLPIISKDSVAQGQSAQPSQTISVSPLPSPGARPGPFKSPLPLPKQPSPFVSPLPTPAKP